MSQNKITQQFTRNEPKKGFTVYFIEGDFTLIKNGLASFFQPIGLHKMYASIENVDIQKIEYMGMVYSMPGLVTYESSDKIVNYAYFL